MWWRLWYTLCTTCRPNRSRTVTYAFPFIAIVAVIAGTFAAVISNDESYIKIESSAGSVRAGETFFVTVSAVAHTPVNAVDISVTFPRSQMEVLGVDTGGSVITLWTDEPYEKRGVVYLRGGTYRKGFVGEHEIARVRVKAIESGTAYISSDDVTFVAGDGKGTIVSVKDTDTNTAKIYVTNADGSFVGNATVQIITDIDGDGDVDITDISAFMAGWFNKDVIFDFNGDGRMTFRDFSILLADSFFK